MNYKGITGMPGPGGSLGQCAVCGKDFMIEIIMNSNVKVMGLEGLDKDFCVHDKCEDALSKAIESHDWHDIPVGPLRKVFEEANPV